MNFLRSSLGWDFMKYKKIWWIASYPKSGNTWVRLFLKSYFFGGELDINCPFSVTNIDCRTAMYQAVCPEPIGRLDIDTLMCLRSAALLHLVATNPEHDLFVKSHHANILVGESPAIPCMFTRGGLYIVRDPRDVLVSYTRHICRLQKDVTIDRVLRHMEVESAMTGRTDTLQPSLLGSWSTNVRSWIYSKTFPITRLRYEDMVSDPAKFMRIALHALGLRDLDEERFANALVQTEFVNLQRAELERGYVEYDIDDRPLVVNSSVKRSSDILFFRSGKVGIWKDELTTEQASRVVDTHGDMMQKLEYI